MPIGQLANQSLIARAKANYDSGKQGKEQSGHDFCIAAFDPPASRVTALKRVPRTG